MKTHNGLYYYMGVSGRIRFVTFDDNQLSNERMPLKKYTETMQGTFLARSVEPAKNLIGKRVELNGHMGVIKEVLSEHTTSFHGKYIGDGKYLSHPKMLQHNHMVRVYWESGFNPVWVPAFELKILD